MRIFAYVQYLIIHTYIARTHARTALYIRICKLYIITRII